MAARVLSQIRKSFLFNTINQSNFSPRGFSTYKHSQSSPAPGSYGSGLLPRNLNISPAFRSVIEHPYYGSSSSGIFTRLSQSLRYNSTSGIYTNTNIRFAKQRRNRGEMKGGSENLLCFGRYALQALEPAWITSRQILAGQLAIKRNVRGGKLMIRVFPHKPVSLRPAETRMGRGKGSTAFWVAGVKRGRILYEIKGVPESVARRAISVAASKMPVRTQFIRSSGANH